MVAADMTSHEAAVEVPSRWTALVSQDLPYVETSWSEFDPPVELLDLPANFRLQPKLVQILDWSLQRPAQTKPKVPRESTQQIDSGAIADAASHENTIGKNGAVLTRHRRSASLERDLPSIKSTKNNLKLAINRVKTLKQKHEIERAASVQVKKEIEPQAECISCFEDLPAPDVIKLTCSHRYCKPCLATLVVTALQNESAFPPKCCLTEIPRETVIIPLDSTQRELYKNKAAEYSIPANRRWYCANTACTKWIPPNKLQRNRMTPQKCPHCSVKICSICRGVAHNSNTDCPQDFGLEATLDIAEFEGWRRCYSCRTMVERQDGCRHITCKCGAQFCYVCGAKWGTCRCTDVDEENRRLNLQRQRGERDAAAQAEADEVAQAIAAVERAAQAAEESRQRRQRQRELERRQEEAELARLEQIRLAEEHQRHLDEEQAEQQLQEALRLSALEEGTSMLQSLRQVFNHQHITLDDRHGRSEQRLFKKNEKTRDSQNKNHKQLEANITRNVNRRVERLKTQQVVENQALVTQQELEQDDVFLQIQLHLKGQPNRDFREARLKDELGKHQISVKQQLEARHSAELERLQKSAAMELEGISRAAQSKEQLNAELYRHELDQLYHQAAIERMWFHTICKRRKVMVEEHNRLFMKEFEEGSEPVGLTMELATEMLNLPVQKRQLPHKTKRLQRRSLSSYETAPEFESSKEVQGDSVVISTANSSPLPKTSSTVALSSSALSYPGLPVPQNGNAYLCTKNGESSKPVCFPPPPPPTPPATLPLPRIPDIAGGWPIESSNLSAPASPSILGKEIHRAKKADLHIQLPKRQSAVSNLEVFTPATPVSTPMSLGAVSPVEQDMGRKGKKSRNPFRRSAGRRFTDAQKRTLRVGS